MKIKMHTIENVTQEEFKYLKKHEPYILSGAKSEVNGEFGAQVQEIKVSLVYDGNTSSLGFILNNGNGGTNVNGSPQLKPAEESLILSLKSNLEGKLNKLKIVRNWMDEA